MPRDRKNPIAKAKTSVRQSAFSQGKSPVSRSRKVFKPPENTKLTVELVPKTCWFSNVRSNVTREQWDGLRKPIAEKANNVCEICSGRGPKWPVECHEVWGYDDENHVQTLLGLVAVCPSCHQVKHYGLAQLQGKEEIAKAHLEKVNGWSKEQTEEYLEGVRETFRERSGHDWKLDLTWLEQFDIHVDPNR